MKRDLEAELAGIEEQIAPLMSQQARKREQLTAIERLLEIETGDPAASPPVASSSNGVTAAALAVLDEHRKPMHYSDLLARIETSGVTVPGRQPGTNLIAHLSRDPRFARVGNGLYALKDWGMKPMPKRRRAKRSRRA